MNIVFVSTLNCINKVTGLFEKRFVLEHNFDIRWTIFIAFLHFPAIFIHSFVYVSLEVVNFICVRGVVFSWEIKESVYGGILKLTENKALSNLIYLNIWQFTVLLKSKNIVACIKDLWFVCLIFLLDNNKRKRLVSIRLNSRSEELL